jgi:hypothetical protein
MITYITRDQTCNLGDILACPNNYFNIESDQPTYIVGGGQWNLFELPYKNVYRTIAWSVGISIHLLQCSLTINQLPLLKWSLRDIDFTNQSHFLPCVTCLHNEIMFEPIGNETLYYFNGDQMLSFGDNIITNNSDYSTFINKWKHSEVIITNSYHGIYWGLLSGRSVIPFGYSTKFISLMKSFDLEFPMDNFYDNHNINHRSIIKKANCKKIKSTRLYLDQFKSMNLEFAESLRMHDVICKPSVMN